MRSALLIAALGALAGCQAVGQDPSLQPFSDCEGMRSYMSDMAQREVRAAHTFSFAIGLGGCMGADEYSIAMQDGGDTESSYAEDYSSTNVQEQGVDEADLVKTDGRHIYALADGWLITSVGWPLDEAVETNRVRIDGYPSGLYLYEDTVVVVSDLRWEAPQPRSEERIPWWSQETTDWRDPRTGGVVTVLDAADPTAPVVQRETYVSGRIESSRRIGDLLYLVTYDDIEVADRWADLREIKQIVDDASPEDWLPHSTDAQLGAGEWTTRTDPSCGCEDVYWSKRETGTFMTTVMSLNLADPYGTLEGQSVVGRADTVYSSREGLYVAYSEEPDGPFRSLDPQLDTVIHKFDISKGEPHPTYVDTVQLTGVLTDQFAMSERAGVLRVATTDQSTWTSSVWTLQEGEQGLERLGHLGGLAPGEELYSVRFVGPIGYLVTYEVAEEPMSIDFGDPLFTIDLSNPSDITAVGELVMNGWSDYIHPLDEDHLLTVGMDEDEDETWKVAVSLFDVSDLAHPVLADREIIQARSSEAQTEHHAFTYLESRQALTLPIQTLDWDWALQVLHVDTEGVEAMGQMSQDSVSAGMVIEESEDWSCTRIRRSIIMEDKVWAMSEGGLTAAALEAPEIELAAVPFTGLGSCDWW